MKDLIVESTFLSTYVLSLSQYKAIAHLAQQQGFCLAMPMPMSFQADALQASTAYKSQRISLSQFTSVALAYVELPDFSIVIPQLNHPIHFHGHSRFDRLHGLSRQTAFDYKTPDNKSIAPLDLCQQLVTLQNGCHSHWSTQTYALGLQPVSIYHRLLNHPHSASPRLAPCSSHSDSCLEPARRRAPTPRPQCRMIHGLWIDPFPRKPSNSL